MAIPGSQYLSLFLHVLAQGLLIPVILGLLYFSCKVLLELGSLLGEWKQRRQKRTKPEPIASIISLHYSQNYMETVGKNVIPEMAVRVLKNLEAKNIVKGIQDIAVRELLEKEEARAIRTLERTDTIVKLGPMLGLMGTLIPLGPGLAALGNGDMTALAQAVILAFDTTVVGLAVAAVAYLISKTRRYWYSQDLSTTEGLVESMLKEVGTDAKPPAQAFVSDRRG